MFDSIQGRLARAEPTRAFVEAGGIGYEIHVPLSTSEGLPAVDEEVRLLLHPVIRESEWRLFGFLTPGERASFRALLRVGGVGPMMALGLLSGLKPAELQAAVSHGDVRALTRVKGIGKKTAERIVVELRDVVGQGADLAAPAKGADTGVVEDAIRALVQLGFEPIEARRRVEAKAGDEEMAVGELVRLALRG